ncbi:MAG: thioredoxin family protein [Acidobacteriota bacterium]|nr:MAG: thioredoxin family protein [Acidobacteriota bacterium]
MTEQPSSDQAPRVFQRTGHFQLRVDGELDEQARLFLSEGVPRLVIEAAALSAPVLVAAQEKTVTVLDASWLSASGSDRSEPAPVPDVDDADTVTLEWPDAAAPAARGVSVERGRVRFQIEGIAFVVEPRDAVVGSLTQEQVFELLPEYRRNAASYEPRKGEMLLLGSLEQPTEVDVFFGSWCPHCERYVPRLLRVLEGLDGSALTYRLYGLPEKLSDDPLARQFGIEVTPIAIVRRGEREIGRISGQLWNRPEAALTALLFGGAGG